MTRSAKHSSTPFSGYPAAQVDAAHRSDPRPAPEHRKGAAPLVDGQQGKRSLELITAIYKSAITRAVVSLPIHQDDPFYRTGGTNALAPVFMKNPQALPTSAKWALSLWAKIWIEESEHEQE